MRERKRERERERGAEDTEGEARSMQGARRGTGSQVSRIRPWAEGGAKPLSHPGCPKLAFLRTFGAQGLNTGYYLCLKHFSHTVPG